MTFPSPLSFRSAAKRSAFLHLTPTLHRIQCLETIIPSPVILVSSGDKYD